MLAGARCLAAIGEWTSDAPGQHPPPGPSPPGRSPHRAVAVDGKTMRGSGHHDTSQLHLLAVMDHTTCGVLGLTGVDGKANEITRFQPPPNHAPATPPAGHGQPAQPRHRHPAAAHRNIAAALRRNARDATRVLPLLGITRAVPLRGVRQRPLR